MNFKDLVIHRASCRKFLSQPVEREKILQCIESARLAPSACNAQPWKFIVVDDPEIKTKLCDHATAGIYRFSRWISTAPVIIVVVADKGSFLSRSGSFVRNTQFYLIDIGIACEHIVLQATELGLGTCYIGWFNEPGVKKFFNIPRKYNIPLLILLGYPKENFKEQDFIRTQAQSNTRKNLNDIVSFNKF